MQCLSYYGSKCSAKWITASRAIPRTSLRFREIPLDEIDGLLRSEGSLVVDEKMEPERSIELLPQRR